MKTFKRTCNKLNKILENRPESRSEFIDTINEIIYNEVFNYKGGLYWNRELFIDCGTDVELCRKMIHTNKVMFIPTDDPIEHPGITLTYKPEFRKEQY
jgi:hypothetical protein